MFIGREKELNIIENRIKSDKFEFGILYGRRRIGKTRLLQEVVKGHGAIYYVANEMGLDRNLQQLSRVLAAYYDEPVTFESYEDVFKYLVKRSKEEKTILIIDEFTYLMSDGQEILSVLQNIIDHELANTNLKLLISGSNVGMIEDALSYKKPLYGRSTFKIKLEPFDYYDTAKFYPGMSAEDKVRLYSVFGGIPFYARQVDDKKTVKENILNLIIEEGAIFANETEFFLSQEVRSITNYGKIIHAIATGASRLNEITIKSALSNTGQVSNYLDTLRTMGIVQKEVCFGEGNRSRKTIYRLKDQLFNFYYRFIEGKKSQKTIMEAQYFYELIIAPYLDEFVSLEFENICKEFLIRKYKNTIEEIGRYWYNDPRKKLDLEIDIVMKEAGQLYVFECKWTNSVLDQKIMRQLQEKATYLGPAKIGFFSRSGCQLEDETLACYKPEDLF